MIPWESPLFCVVILLLLLLKVFLLEVFQSVVNR